MANDADLGPLAVLLGTWEGDKGDDTAPDDDLGVEVNKFRERIVFAPTGQVDNHAQTLFGLRYATTAWRIGEPDPFHEEVGYWMWDAKARLVVRCFVIPRGIAVNAGGSVEPGATTFTLRAERGAAVLGITASPFLDREFRTESFAMKVTLGTDTWSYDEDTVLAIAGQPAPFHHTDRNTLRRVA